MHRGAVYLLILEIIHPHEVLFVSHGNLRESVTGLVSGVHKRSERHQKIMHAAELGHLLVSLGN